jgi:hypothetical protein
MQNPQPGFFFEDPGVIRTGDRKALEQYVIDRLGTIFPGVAPRGAVLRNRRSALYLLTFCGSNPNPAAQKLALRECLRMPCWLTAIA